MLSPYGISRVRQAQALSYGSGHVDIYIASWGPSDDAKSVGSVSTLAKWTLQAEATMVCTAIEYHTNISLQLSYSCLGMR